MFPHDWNQAVFGDPPALPASFVCSEYSCFGLDAPWICYHYYYKHQQHSPTGYFGETWRLCGVLINNHRRNHHSLHVQLVIDSCDGIVNSIYCFDSLYPTTLHRQRQHSSNKGNVWKCGLVEDKVVLLILRCKLGRRKSSSRRQRGYGQHSDDHGVWR